MHISSEENVNAPKFLIIFINSLGTCKRNLDYKSIFETKFGNVWNLCTGFVHEICYAEF